MNENVTVFTNEVVFTSDSDVVIDKGTDWLLVGCTSDMVVIMSVSGECTTEVHPAILGTCFSQRVVKPQENK